MHTVPFYNVITYCCTVHTLKYTSRESCFTLTHNKVHKTCAGTLRPTNPIRATIVKEMMATGWLKLIKKSLKYQVGNNMSAKGNFPVQHSEATGLNTAWSRLQSPRSSGCLLCTSKKCEKLRQFPFTSTYFDYSLINITFDGSLYNLSSWEHCYMKEE